MSLSGRVVILVLVASLCAASCCSNPENNTAIIEPQEKADTLTELQFPPIEPIPLSDSVRQANDSIDIMLAVAAQDFYENGFESMRHVSIFRNKVNRELQNPFSFYNDWDSLGTQIRIRKSSDGLFKTFCWDELSGGTWHDMAGIIQYKNPKGEVKTSNLDTDNEMRDSEYTDVIVQNIHTVIINDRKHYLTIGWGTHGAGHHHQTASLFTIEDELVYCKNAFNGRKDLVTVSARSHWPYVYYNSETEQLIQYEFVPDLGDFLKPSGDSIIWTIQGEMFKPNEELQTLSSSQDRTGS